MGSEVKKQEIMRRLKDAGVVPVIRSRSADHVLPVVGALREGGIPVAEVTMTVPDALEIMKSCSGHFGPRLTLGAGTVTDAGTCEAAILAGCHFIVTPSVNLDVVRLCVESHVCVIAGALTPTEILTVWEAGADAVKVFPVRSLGGASYIRMLHEPFPHIPLVPTGGVNLETLGDYLRAGAIFVGAGGDLASGEAVSSGRTEAVRERVRQYVAAIRTARGEGR